jgi:hypothetical protein
MFSRFRTAYGKLGPFGTRIVRAIGAETRNEIALSSRENNSELSGEYTSIAMRVSLSSGLAGAQNPHWTDAAITEMADPV